MLFKTDPFHISSVLFIFLKFYNRKILHRRKFIIFPYFNGLDKKMKNISDVEQE